VALQHTSLAFWLQALSLPTAHVLFTHLPLEVSQISPPAHCESAVHLPQKFGSVTPQIEPFALPAQSGSVRQSPGEQIPDKHKLFAP
jgi:hypothetical protein